MFTSASRLDRLASYRFPCPIHHPFTAAGTNIFQFSWPAILGVAEKLWSPQNYTDPYAQVSVAHECTECPPCCFRPTLTALAAPAPTPPPPFRATATAST